MQLALAAAGAAAGSFFGLGIPALGLSGAAVGWGVGSFVGSVLGAKGVHTVQPGIGDKAIQASTYGAFQTLVYGTMRVAGNVIDGVGEVREVLTTTRTGKGGAKSSNTTRTWNADVAIDLAQAGCLGIRKIWQAGKLVYDVSSGASAASIIASALKATSFKLYDGSETQLPDPTLESLHGVGNVPAYRGRSYCVLAGVDCPNGQIPQLQFEVCMSVTVAGTLAQFTPAVQFQPDLMYSDYVRSSISRICGPNVVYHLVRNAPASDYYWSVQGFKAGAGYVKSLWASVHPSYGTGNYGRWIGMNGGHRNPMAVRAVLGINGVYSTTNTTVLIDMRTGAETVLREFTPGTVDYDFVPAAAAYDDISEKFVLVGDGNSGRTYEKANPAIWTVDGVFVVRLALASTVGYPIAMYNDIVYVLDQRSGQTYVQMYDGTSGAFIDEVGGGPATIDTTTFSSANDPDSGVSWEGYLSAISAHGGGVFVYAKNLGQVWRVDSAWREISSTIANSTTTTHGVENCYIEEDYIVEGPLTASPDGDCHYRVAPTKSFDPLDVSVGSIIEAAAELAGLESGQLDTTDQTDTLRGYAITRQSTARAAIEPLLKAFFVDSREQDGQIQFLNRAEQTSSFSVSFDELGASEDGGLDDPFPLSRADVNTLPRSVAVTFVDVSADYQVGSQSAVRQTVTNRNEQTDELPMAITAARAATAAEVLLYDAWSNANTRTVRLSRKFAAVSPGDVGTFEYPSGTYTLKRVVRAVDDGAIVTLDLVDGDAALYELSATGAEQNAGQDGPTVQAPTVMALMDLPILRDVDNDNGIYVAMAALTTPWVGATLFKGNDDSTLEAVASVTTATSIGVATTVLANWTDNTPDWVNTVTVRDVGTLSSSTLDGCLDNGDNLCLLGYELLQFVTATLVSTGVYTLSGLIRGRRGTERYKATHLAYERFVLLPTTGAGMVRPVLDLGELNVQRQYRAITSGLELDSEPSTAFASTGMALKPLSPVNFKRSALDGNSTLSWDRRSRLSGEFPDSSDIALGEAAELYYIDVYSDSTFELVVRTLTCVDPTVVYTLAQQTVDFAGYQTTLYLRIHQVSALVGRGVPLEVTSTVSNLNSTPPSLLAHFDGVGVIVTPIDSSAYAHACTLFGSAALSATQSKFGGSSLYVPGGAVSDYASFATTTGAHNFGTGDFTIEYWFYPTGSDNRNCFALSPTGSLADFTATSVVAQCNQSAQSLTVNTYSGGSLDSTMSSASSAFTANAWNHVAITRKSGTMRLFINGVQKATTTSSGSLNWSASQKVNVGGWNVSANIGVYYDEVRILKGEAIYFDTFVPATAAY